MVQQIRQKFLLQLAQQFTSDFLTPAASFDSVNNGYNVHCALFFGAPMNQ
jgi:hypothetical protein